MRNLQVVADKDNNTLLIIATPAEYLVIEAALKKLDVPQRQVLIEVTIAEVTLSDELQFGVEWLFKGGAPSGRGAGGLFNRQPCVQPWPADHGHRLATNIAQGFIYLINNANFPGGIQAALRLLDSYGSTKIVANPHVGALDNQKATIKAGNRIPINQQTLVDGTANAVTTTSQYIDTGRPAAGHAAHQRRRAGRARRPGRGQQSRATRRGPATPRRSTPARCRPTCRCPAGRRWSWAA